jgi:hypothetical protein
VVAHSWSVSEIGRRRLSLGHGIESVDIDVLSAFAKYAVCIQLLIGPTIAGILAQV